MLSERNRVLFREVFGTDQRWWDEPMDPTYINRLIDAARAEGGAGERLATGSLGSGSTAPPEAPPPPPGGVEEQIVDMLRAYADSDPDRARAHYQRKAADALLSQSRLLEERTRERDEALRQVAKLRRIMATPTGQA